MIDYMELILGEEVPEEEETSSPALAPAGTRVRRRTPPHSGEEAVPAPPQGWSGDTVGTRLIPTEYDVTHPAPVGIGATAPGIAAANTAAAPLSAAKTAAVMGAMAETLAAESPAAETSADAAPDSAEGSWLEGASIRPRVAVRVPTGGGAAPLPLPSEGAAYLYRDLVRLGRAAGFAAVGGSGTVPAPAPGGEMTPDLYALDRLVRLDARRYDAGFSIY